MPCFYREYGHPRVTSSGCIHVAAPSQVYDTQLIIYGTITISTVDNNIITWQVEVKINDGYKTNTRDPIINRTKIKCKHFTVQYNTVSDKTAYIHGHQNLTMINTCSKNGTCAGIDSCNSHSDMH